MTSSDSHWPPPQPPLPRPGSGPGWVFDDSGGPPPRPQKQSSGCGPILAVVVGVLVLLSLIGSLFENDGDLATSTRPSPQAPTTVRPQSASTVSRSEIFRDLAIETDSGFASMTDQTANQLGADLCGMARDSATDREFRSMLGVLWASLDEDTKRSLFRNDIEVLDIVARKALLAYCAEEQLRLNLGS